MTKWQESCITALASSPFTWEAFKMKQRNKNLLWQYINRIWPYHNVKNNSIVTNSLKNKSLEACLHELLNILSKYEKRILSNSGYDLRHPIIFKITEKDKVIIEKISNLHPSKRYISSYLYTSFNHTLLGEDIDVFRRTDLIRCLELIPLDKEGSFSSICCRMTNCEQQIVACRHSIMLLLQEYGKIRENNDYKTKKKTPKYKTNWLNVGIEIEHDAQNKTSKEIVKRILQQNCIEYDSGYDGGMSIRLRENRIRLNGIKGLKGLYTLLQDMQENAAIAENSSVHMHIDCDFDNSYHNVTRKIYVNNSEIRRRYTTLEQFFVDFILNNKILDEFVKIFNLGATSNINAFENWVNHAGIIRFNDEFNTIEYRFCIPNFNYSDYVIQILFLIHITECIKHNSPINKNYVTMLYKIINSIRNDS